MPIEYEDQIPFEPFQSALMVALIEIAQFAMERAQWWSSGHYSSKRLAGPPWFHPYAADKKGPYPYGDPARINIQSGTFLRSWRMSPPRDRGDMYIIAIRNIASYATDQEEGRPGFGGWVKRPLPTRVANELESRPKVTRILYSNLRTFVGGYD